MPITNYDETSELATKYLSSAIQAEHRRNWTEAIGYYQRLMNLIQLKNMPQPYAPPPGYKMALFEAHFHHGVCYQQTANHAMSIQYFSRAVEAILSPQNGCLIDCCSSASLSVPARARLAFSLASIGRQKEAMRQLEMASGLDQHNQDILCMQIITKMLAGDPDRARKLLNKGLSDRGTLEHPGCQALQQHLNGPRNPFESVESFEELGYQGQLEFIERFLFSVHLSHTITAINLNPTHYQRGSMNCVVCREQEPMADISSRSGFPMEIMKWKQFKVSDIKPLKCGLVHMQPDRHPVVKETIHATKHRRRLEYSYNVLSQLRATTAPTSLVPPECAHNQDAEKSFPEWTSEGNYKMPGSMGLLEIASRDVPRTYIRGWKGDKLTPASLPLRAKQPIFYPAYL